MKTILIILFVLFACISCTTNNKGNQPLSDSQKEKVKSEVELIVDTIFKGCEEANLKKAIGTWLDSPDFIAIVNSNMWDYKGVKNVLDTIFQKLRSQQISRLDEKYSFINDSTVIYSAKLKTIENYKDGRVVQLFPDAIQFTFMKTKGYWKVINAIESSLGEILIKDEASKKLNQVALMKQFAGSWKGNFGKDTLALCDIKTYDAGLEGYYKIESKGKILKEAKQIYIYDKKYAVYLITEIFKDQDIKQWGIRFTAKNKYILIPEKDIENPAKASFKEEGEFKTPNLLVVRDFVNNNVTTFNFTKVK
ncbi:MAG: hypothetical protein Q8859_08525 [Bacteroidota bacterium]|nr:hypothetical protein [Bacteroidota bacterium]